MNNIPRVLLIIGFILSILTNIFLLLIYTVLLSLYIYPVSILFRGLGWLSSGVYIRVNILSGLAVLILGFSLFIGLVGEHINSISLIIYLWSIYTVLEACSYYRLSKYAPVFKVGMISLLGVVYSILIINIFPGLWEGVSNDSDIVIYFIPVYILNIISCISVLTGILKIGGIKYARET